MVKKVRVSFSLKRWELYLVVLAIASAAFAFFGMWVEERFDLRGRLGLVKRETIVAEAPRVMMDELSFWEEWER